MTDYPIFVPLDRVDGSGPLGFIAASAILRVEAGSAQRIVHYRDAQGESIGQRPHGMDDYLFMRLLGLHGAIETPSY